MADAEQAKIRDDLIRRLFAVAISVGAASTLANMGWVHKGSWPTLPEWQQLSILLAAMTATVLSWDGDLRSISQRPLYEFWRFAIDISLVFIYMFLLMTSNHPTWWLTIHAVTYILYVIWDHLTVRWQTEKYFDDNFVGIKTTTKVYVGGALNQAGVSRGPIITLAWAFYFVALVAINWGVLANSVFATTIFALAGLIIYRLDKQARYQMSTRLLIIVCLVFIDFVFARCTTILRDDLIFNFADRYIG